MSVKSKAALQYNIDILFGNCESVYFWTFTLPIRMHPREGAVMWRDLLRELRRTCKFWGVRVFELHPSGHGLHVHVATGQWFDVNAVRRICLRFGWGRLHVEKWDNADKEKASAYMGKYLGKSLKGFSGLKGMRWWSVFGSVPDRVRVCDVRIESLRRQIWDMVPSWIVSAIAGCGHSDSGKSRSFNMAKMWLCNKIYYRCKNLSGSIGNRVSKWGIKPEFLQYDFDELLRGAIFLSDVKVGGV